MIVGANGENIYPEEIESLINNFKHVAESIVIQKKGQLVAMVHFNREELEQRVREMKADFTHKIDEKMEEISQMVDATINELADELKHYINTRVSKSSRIQALIIQPDPFEKNGNIED
jgi:long-chain acyl-CoA synthetase